VTDPAAPDVRATIDVDMIVEATATLEFHAIEAVMRDRGFQPDIERDFRHSDVTFTSGDTEDI